MGKVGRGVKGNHWSAQFAHTRARALIFVSVRAFGKKIAFPIFPAAPSFKLQLLHNVLYSEYQGDINCFALGLPPADLDDSEPEGQWVRWYRWTYQLRYGG